MIGQAVPFEGGDKKETAVMESMTAVDRNDINISA